MPKFSREERYAIKIIVRIIMPTKPSTALMHKYKKRSMDIAPT